MKISIFELIQLRRNLKVSKEHDQSLRKLFEIGEANLEEHGVDLIKKLQLFQGISDEEIIKEIKNFDKIMNGQHKITNITAEKLSKFFGLPKKAFFRRPRDV